MDLQNQDELLRQLKAASEAKASFTPPAGLEDRIYQATLPLVRRRTERRWLRAAGLAVAAYAAGLLTVVSVQRVLPQEDTRAATVEVASAPLPAPPAETSPRSEKTDAPPQDARMLEAEAVTASFDQRPALLRGAGDRYLAEGNITRAAHCYTQFLQLSQPSEASASSTDDSWLLLSLKSSIKSSSLQRQG